MKFEVEKKYKSSITGKIATCRYIGDRRVCLEADSGELYVPELPGSCWEPYVEKKKGWVNIQPSIGSFHLGYIYPSRSIADSAASSGRVACIEIEYYEGQGLGPEGE